MIDFPVQDYCNLNLRREERSCEVGRDTSRIFRFSDGRGFARRTPETTRTNVRLVSDHAAQIRRARVRVDFLPFNFGA